MLPSRVCHRHRWKVPIVRKGFADFLNERRSLEHRVANPEARFGIELADAKKGQLASQQMDRQYVRISQVGLNIAVHLLRHGLDSSQSST